MTSLLSLDKTTIYIILSVGLSTIAHIPYFIEIWQIKETQDVRPTISGWTSWLLTDSAILAAMIARHNIAWQMVPYIIGSTIVILLSLRKGLKLAHMRGEVVSWRDAFMDWGLKDTICVSIVAIAIIAWGIKRDPDYTIYLAVFSGIIGAWAVTWPLCNDPYRESLLAWTIFLVGGFFGIMAITEWTFAGAAVPISIFFIQGTIVVLATRRYLPRPTQAPA